MLDRPPKQEPPNPSDEKWGLLKYIISELKVGRMSNLERKDILLIILVPAAILVFPREKIISPDLAANGFYVWLVLMSYRIIIHPWLRAKSSPANKKRSK